ncbi:MAG: hypothetical protein FJX45_12620 [Alphaproteobacteria bacterium]|nr:hypothetical protein [Alphaproteobacteria bacterium]
MSIFISDEGVVFRSGADISANTDFAISYVWRIDEVVVPNVKKNDGQSSEETGLIAGIARRIPPIISPTHLTLAGLAGAVLVAVGFIATRSSHWFLALVVVGLVVNWLGESLERAVAARRGVTFPFYGYFINNSADLVAQTLMILAFGFSPYFTVPSALLVLSLFMLLSSYKYLLVVIHGEERPPDGLEPKGVRLFVMGWSLSAALLGHELASQRILSFAALDVVVGGLSIFAFVVFILIVRRDLALVRLHEHEAANDRSDEFSSDEDEIIPHSPDGQRL